MSGLMKKWLPTMRRGLSLTQYMSSDKFHIRTKSEFVNDLQVIDPLDIDILNVYRIMDRSGKVLNAKQDPLFTKDQAVEMYTTMMQVLK